MRFPSWHKKTTASNEQWEGRWLGWRRYERRKKPARCSRYRIVGFTRQAVLTHLKWQYDVEVPV